MRPALRSSRLVAACALVLAAIGAAAGSAPAATERRAGTDRYATAAAVSAATFDPGAAAAYVANGTGFVEPLVAGVPAGRAGGPVLLVTVDAVPTATADELRRLRPGEVVVVGDTASVSDLVLAELAVHAAAPVRRIAAADAASTSAAVSADTFASADVAWLASDAVFADALAAIPAAVVDDAPLLLTDPAELSPATADELDRLGVGTVRIAGGTGAVGEGVAAAVAGGGRQVERVAGPDRFATAAEIARRVAAPGGSVFLATGATHADAVAAGPAAAATGGVVLTTTTHCVIDPARVELDRIGPDRVVVLGGHAALGRNVEDLTDCPDASRPVRRPTIAPPPTPAWADDGPDPHVVRFGDRWYAYTTGTTWGNNIGVLVSDRPDRGWTTITGAEFGSTALDGFPDWQVPDTQWAPAVYQHGAAFIMFYAAQVAATGEWCLTSAVASGPEGPFVDDSNGPTICRDDLDGVIDPHPFVDADGRIFLHYKNNDGFGTATNDASSPSRVLVQELGPDGRTPLGPSGEILGSDPARFPWQTTVDNPQLVLHEGRYHLFHTGGNYIGDDTYTVGVATCASPIGPCTTQPEPLLRSYGSVRGPGGGTVAVDADGQFWMSYHAWDDGGCFDYPCGGVRRLYVAPMDW